MGMVRGMAHLFNGALIRSATFERFGLPDIRFFIRGDEIDFLLRVRRGGGRIVTRCDVTALHPAGLAEARGILGGRGFVIDPPDAVRRDALFRNRAYILLRHWQMHLLVGDIVRYALYFLCRRRPDWSGWRRWCGSSWQGLRGQLGRPGQGLDERPSSAASGSEQIIHGQTPSVLAVRRARSADE